MLFRSNVTGPLGALAAGSLTAFWFEMVYFSGHALSETLGKGAQTLQ
mgnify:CR=1 FL=1